MSDYPYDVNKLAQARERYQNTIKEAVISLETIDLLEQAGGEMTGIALFQKLIESGVFSDISAEDLCLKLKIAVDQPIVLSDALLDFGLNELL